MITWWKSLNIQTQISIIVVFVSVVSLIVNTIVSLIIKKKDIKATLVSKARIEWISEVRILIADYLKHANKIRKNLPVLDISKDEIERLPLIASEIKADILELDYKLDIITLYFSDNDENNKIIYSLKDIYKVINDYANFIVQDKSKVLTKDKKNEHGKILKTKMNDCLQLCRGYLKKEWEQAKKGQ